MSQQTIACLGTGVMGKQLVFKLLEKGYKVQVYDKYKEASDPVVAAGAIWKDSPVAVAQDADLVMTILPLPSHVSENMLGDRGALSSMKPGSTWLDFSTSDYHNTQKIVGEATKKGIFSLEAPVSNLSHMGVDFGNVSFYVSGDKEGYEMSQPALSSMGKKSFFVSETIGEAQTVKLLTNLLCYTGIILLGEILTIAKVNGIPLLWMWDFIKASQGRNWAAEQITPFIFDGSYDHSCSLQIAAKDTRLTVKLADELNVPLPLGQITEERYRSAKEKYGSHENYVKVNQLIEEDNNLDLRVPGFTAPSPYGANRSYVHSEEKVADRFGRIKPRPYETEYAPPAEKLDRQLMDIAESIAEFMAYVNYLSWQEAYQLGKKRGLNKELLMDAIRWSCGMSWVGDHIDSYQPNPEIVKKIEAFDFCSQAKLPAIAKILAVLKS